jgi:hypothetical protein
VEVRGIASGVTGESWASMASEELTAVMRPVEGAVAMCGKPIMEMPVVEIPVVKVTMMMVKDDE